jgi:hypothetical protein
MGAMMVPCLMGGRLALDHRQVLAGGDSLLDLGLLAHERLLAFGHDDAAGGVLIKAADDARPHLAADAGELGAVVEPGVHQGDVLVAWSGVNGETGGFVEVDEMGILEEHIEGDALGQQVWEGFGGGTSRARRNRPSGRGFLARPVKP